MSKSNLTPEYREPFTGIGVRLGGEGTVIFQLHESGCRLLADEWNHPNVRSPFWRLYWAAQSGAWIECSDQSYDLAPGHFLLVPSHVLFDTHGAKHPITHFWIHFSLYPDFAVKSGTPVRVTCGRDLARQTTALVRQVRRARPEDQPSLYHLCGALLHQIFARSEGAVPSPRFPARLNALLREIEMSLDQPAAVTHLAKRVGMSRGSFIRWFRRHLDLSPARYVMSRRIDHACRLLKFSDATIDDIASRLGFANRSHFSRAFQKRMGVAPVRFRRS